MKKTFTAISLVVASILIGMLMSSTGKLASAEMETATMTPTARPTCPPDCDALRARMKESGALHLIIRLNIPFQSDLTDEAAITTQRQVIRMAQQNLIQALSIASGQRPIVDLGYDATPYLVLSIENTSSQLEDLINSPDVLAIEEDTPDSPLFDLELGKIKAETDRLTASQATSAAPDKCLVAGCTDLIAAAKQQGQIRIIVGVGVQWQGEGGLSPTAQQVQRAQIRLADAMLLKELEPFHVKVLAHWSSIPYMGLSANAVAIQDMVVSPLVKNIRKEGVGRLS